MTTVRRTDRRRAIGAGCSLAAALACTGCGGDATGPQNGKLAISVGITADTVQSEHENVLHVKVTSGGQPVAKVVTFHVVHPSLSDPPDAYIAVLAAHPLEAPLWMEEDFVSSNAEGDAYASVQLGRRAGSVQIEVRCDGVGVRDTVTFTILPGHAVRAAALPEDTAVTIGHTVQLDGDLLDRFGNRRGEPASFSGASANIQVSATGLVSGNDYGVGRVVVSGAGFVDTGHVSVVPEGEIAAYQRGPYEGDTGEVVLVRLDGSNRRSIARPWAAIFVDWWGGLVAYDGAYIGNDGLGHRRIETIGDNGASAPAILIGLSRDSRAMPRISTDGTWIYYYYVPQFFDLGRLRRVHPDGSGDATVGPVPPVGHLYYKPSPSPDDTRLAIVTNGPDNAEVRVMDLATNSLSSWRVVGSVPAWSPDGGQIAYIDVVAGTIRTVAPDGTGDAQRSPAGAIYLETTPAWTPDGKWLVAEGADSLLHVVQVASGMDLPLPYSGRWTSPARHR